MCCDEMMGTFLYHKLSLSPQHTRSACILMFYPKYPHIAGQSVPHKLNYERTNREYRQLGNDADSQRRRFPDERHFFDGRIFSLPSFPASAPNPPLAANQRLTG